MGGSLHPNTSTAWSSLTRTIASLLASVTLPIRLLNHAPFRLLKARKQIVDLLLQIREIRLENLGGLFTSE